MGLIEARKFWEIFDSLTKSEQGEYLNEAFGDLLFDITKEWDEETIRESTKELEVFKNKKTKGGEPN